jgi:hypothetical protein
MLAQFGAIGSGRSSPLLPSAIATIYLSGFLRLRPAVPRKINLNFIVPAGIAASIYLNFMPFVPAVPRKINLSLRPGQIYPASIYLAYRTSCAHPRHWTTAIWHPIATEVSLSHSHFSMTGATFPDRFQVGSGFFIMAFSFNLKFHFSGKFGVYKLCNTIVGELDRIRCTVSLASGEKRSP